MFLSTILNCLRRHRECLQSTPRTFSRQARLCRPSLERLEDRTVPRTVTVSGLSLVHLDVGTIQKGDTVNFQVDSWRDTDKNDIYENEPLIIQSSGGLHKIIQQEVSGSFTYTAQAKGETFSAYILNGDGDEWVDISTETTDINLVASLDGFKIVPTQATDLHLKQFYGGEQVTVPVTIGNDGQTEAKGQVTVELFLSTTPNLSGSITPKAFATQTTTIDLLNGKTQDVNVTSTIPINSSALVAGNSYYFVARVTSTTIKESDANNGNDANNIAAGDRQFEYMGTPSYLSVFSSGTYFQFIRDTLKNDTSAATAQNPAVNVSDPRSFIASFEGDSLSPYLDSKNIPTIGVGLNLASLSSDMVAPLAADVRSYYASQYHDNSLKTMTDKQVIAMLANQALAHVSRPAISAAADQALFNQSYLDHQKIAIAGLGQVTFNSLSAREQVAVMDQVYNGGSVYPGMAKALQHHDFLLAGFNLTDALQTQNGLTARGALRRVEAEFENLLAGHKDDLVFSS